MRIGNVILGQQPLANNSGTWTFTPSSRAYGVHRISVRATDVAGNASTFSPLLKVTIGPVCLGEPSTRTGANGADNLVGTNGPDVISGLKGKDTINGRGGGDLICGGGANDTLKGGGGNDQLDGNGGNDTCDGGPGNGDGAVRCETQTNIP